MKVKSSKLRVKSYSEKLSAFHFSLFTDKRGFTLIEVIMIIVVVSIAIPTLLIVLGQGARQGVNAELEISATNVAQALMEEIKSKNWDQNSPIPPGAYSILGIDGGETAGIPSTYNDVDDYNAGAPAVTVGGVSYTRAVQVCYVPSTNLNDTSACNTTTDYKRIQVTVSNATLGSVVLVTVMGNY